MIANKKVLLIVLVCCLSMSFIFGFGSKEPENPTPSSPSLSTQSRTTYGSYTLAGTAANYSYTTSIKQRMSKSYSYTNSVSASGGISIAGVEACVGFKSGTTETVSTEVEIVVEPRKRYGWYTRPIYLEYSVYSNGQSVGSAKKIEGISSYISDNGTF